MSRNISIEEETWGNVQASASFDSDDEALEALVQLKEMEFDVFSNRETDLDSEEEQSIRVHFFKEEGLNNLVLSADGEGDLSIFLSLDGDSIASAASVLNRILPEVGPITVNSLTIHTTVERNFNSLNLPIKENSEYDVQGIRIKHGGHEYIIQKSDSYTHITSLQEPEETVSEEFPDGFLSEDLGEVKSFAESEL